MLTLRRGMEFQSYGHQITREISRLEGMTISEKKVPPKKNSESFGFPDHIYVHAAAVFQSFHVEKPIDRRLVSYGNKTGLPVLESKDEKTQHCAYELAFNALKYQDLLEDIMIDSCLYLSQSMPDELTSLVVVMLYDFQDRKFLPRSCPDRDDEIEEVREVEKCLFRYKTKLAASLARCRIKHDLLTIDFMLPESVRKKQERASSLPLYGWVNTLKASLEDVVSSLEREGFSKVKSITELEGLTFCQDPHCQDLLVFPPHLKADLYRTKLLTDYKLVIQDKSRSLATHSAKALLNPDQDVIIANAASGFTIAHMAALTSQSAGRVLVCGVKSPALREELQDILSHMECRNVKLLPENFADIEPTDVRLQKAKVILLLPPCSASGVSNPVDFILNESGDAGLLRDLSQGSISEERLNALVKQQLQDVLLAVKFLKVLAVVYCTCSLYPEENEEVVRRALEYKPESSKVQPYRLSPPLCCTSEINNARDGFFRVDPSEKANGCFLAVLKREAPSGTVASKDVLARAAAKGLLEGIGSEKHTKKEKRRPKVAVQPVTPVNETQARIAEFLTRESGESAAVDVTEKASANPTLKTTEKGMVKATPGATEKTTAKSMTKATVSSSSWYREMSKSKQTPKSTVSSSVSNSMKKSLPKFSPTSRFYEQRICPPKPRLQEKMSVLKPVELVFPPVMFPSFSPLMNKSRPPPHLSGFLWKGARVTQYSLTPSTARVSRFRETLPTAVVWHPRPWL
ncbi:putative methyltransferase NSUN7 isoform X2 [Amia ocellicauda]|uniref:putative methyltransferase NSUN7 isoform X2 n=1 Tax=Amia ocellicauda TaxID=2972642 RepID=UPI0034642150